MTKFVAFLAIQYFSCVPHEFIESGKQHTFSTGRFSISELLVLLNNQKSLFGLEIIATKTGIWLGTELDKHETQENPLVFFVSYTIRVRQLI